MARRGQTTTLAERVEISDRWTAGQKDPEIAVAMSLPVWTVRKWRRKYQKEGRSGLGSRMGRPATGALGQSPLEMRDTICDMRRDHPGWGPITIRTELEDNAVLCRPEAAQPATHRRIPEARRTFQKV